MVKYMMTFRSLLRSFDKNGDGTISKDELLDVMRCFGRDVSEEEVEGMGPPNQRTDR